MTRTVTVLNPTGFHARPARSFVDIATETFPDTLITLTKGPKVINGKSVLSMLTLGAKCGDSILIEAIGGAEAQALAQLGDLFETIFKE
jgi:phosphotransferase system HPr (HPr) family protein